MVEFPVLYDECFWYICHAINMLERYITAISHSQLNPTSQQPAH